MPAPEQLARQTIDDMLAAASWCVQDNDALNLSAGRGVAVREFSLKTGFADYLLFVDRKAIGAFEAKASLIWTMLPVTWGGGRLGGSDGARHALEWRGARRRAQ